MRVRRPGVRASPTVLLAAVTLLASGCSFLRDDVLDDVLGIDDASRAARTEERPPVLHGVQPEFGPASGGTRITIYGDRFEPGTAFYLGGRSLIDVRFVSRRQVIAVTPPLARPRGGWGELLAVNAHGSSVLSASFRYFMEDDLDGDGVSDVVVMASRWTGANDTGRIYVFRGHSELASTGAAAADAIISGDAAGNLFGVPFATGDLNEDGIADLLAVASGADLAYVFFGQPDFGSRAAGTADAILSAEGAGDFGGVAVGDVTGDGVADAIVGAPAADPGGEADAGRVYVFRGMRGFASRPAAGADSILTGEAAGDNFGAAVAAGDVDRDHVADLLVGATGADPGGLVDAGRAYVFRGGLGPGSRAASTADAILSGEAAGDNFGVVAALDLAGDGWPEFVVGAPDNGGDPGAVYVYASPVPAGGGLVAKITGDAGIGNTDFGARLAAGDLSGDGRPDLVVAAPSVSRVHLFFARRDFSSRGASDADVILMGEAAADSFGFLVVTGNYDGRGAADLLAGAPSNDTDAADAGRAYVFFGGPGLVSQGAATADVVLTGEGAGDRFGGWACGAGSIELLVLLLFLAARQARRRRE
ncbi:MAG: FG-GAP repeat protein [Planctomycetes bacterium]|nr:FG-GAP repeat protein [Planctomycetota bacterium]